jgi:hypothetical protein
MEINGDNIYNKGEKREELERAEVRCEKYGREEGKE